MFSPFVLIYSPYAGSAYAGGLEGCKPSKNLSLLNQARAMPAPG
jgi:hypothetical protein